MSLFFNQTPRAISLKSLSLKEVQLLLNIKLGYSLPFCLLVSCETVAKTGGIQLVT